MFSVSTFTQGSSYTIQLRALDPTDTGTDLLADSRALITVPNSGASTCESLRITPDGATAVCAAQYDFATGNGTNAGGARGGLEFIACSGPHRRAVGVLYRYRGACHNGLSSTLWTNASGRYVIGATMIDAADEGASRPSSSA